MASVASPLACANAVMDLMDTVASGRWSVASLFAQILNATQKLSTVSIYRNSVQIGELHLVQFPIEAQAAHQLLVRTDIGDGAALDDNDAIGAAHRRQSVSDHKDGATCHQIL